MFGPNYRISHFYCGVDSKTLFKHKVEAMFARAAAKSERINIAKKQRPNIRKWGCFHVS